MFVKLLRAFAEEVRAQIHGRCTGTSQGGCICACYSTDYCMFTLMQSMISSSTQRITTASGRRQSRRFGFLCIRVRILLEIT